MRKLYTVVSSIDMNDHINNTQNHSQESENEIEKEDMGVELITTPFNPSQIKIRRDPFTLGQLVDKIRYNEVKFDTPYQRKSDLWDDKAQSRLIESVILKLPLPSFYFDEYDNVSQYWNVIDGLQRCCAFRDFVIKKSLRLVDLEFLNAEYGNKTFEELPPQLQRRILQTPITAIVVEKGTPDIVKFNIFKRINTGGLILTSQEIRHAMNQGVPTQTLAQLVELPIFKKATDEKIPSERMLDQEFVNRFVAFYVLTPEAYSADLDTFMNIGLSKVKTMSESEIKVMIESFERTMNTAYSIWGNDCFRKRTEPDARRRPLNKTLFEVISVCLSRLSEEEHETLVRKKHSVYDGFIELNSNSKFANSISNAIGNRENVVTRHKLFDEFIQSILLN